jgi:Mg2+ and Co2+ transporter CorA
VVDPRDLAVAQSLADELRVAKADGRRRSWRKVTTLLSMFGAGRYTHQVQQRMSAAFTAVGVQTSPSLDKVTRADSVQLSVDDPRVTDTQTLELKSGDVVVQTWRTPAIGPGGVGLSDHRATVRRFDVDADCDPNELLSYLQQHCDDSITAEMVEDLLKADHQPKVHEYQSGEKTLRSVSVVGVEAGEVEETDRRADAATTTGRLTFQLVEFLVGQDWLVTCWHPSRTCTGINHEKGGNPLPKDQILELTRISWAKGRGHTGGDLGLCFARALVDTYPQAHRQVEAWLEQWEFRSFKNLEAAEKTSLMNMLSLVGEFRRRLVAFNHARRVTADKTWFPNVSDPEAAERLDDVLDRALRNLKLLFETVRSDMELMTMQALADQAQTAREQRDASEHLRGQLEKAAALLLVPALIAGIYGANTKLPGYGEWFGFIVMLILMILSAAAALWYIRKRDRADMAWTRGPADPSD